MPLTASEKKRSKAERLARLNALAKSAGDLAGEVERLSRLIDLAAPEARSQLRRRLAEVAAEHGLPSAHHDGRRQPKRTLVWAQSMDPREQDGAGLQAAWLLLVEHMAYNASRQLPDRLQAVHHSLQAEWRRRRSAAELPPEYFIWPSTLAPLGPGHLATVTSPAYGMLAALGYHVGVTSELPAATRLFLLDQVFALDLPLVHSRSYTEEWGDPSTAARLKKLADTLAANVRNARRKTYAQMTQACADWEADLGYLHDAYYARRFGFDWPRPE